MGFKLDTDSYGRVSRPERDRMRPLAGHWQLKRPDVCTEQCENLNAQHNAPVDRALHNVEWT